MRRRDYLVSVSIGVSTLFGGCLSKADSESTATSDETAPDSETTQGPSTSAVASDLIGTYLTAASEQDIDGLSSVVHSESPIREGLDSGEIMLQPGASSHSGADIVVEDATAEDVLSLEYASLQFERSTLEGLFDDEDAMLVSADMGDSSVELDTWVLVTDQDEWRVFWIGARQETPDDPTDAFDEPIEDSEQRVVADITYGEPSEHTAKVTLTDSPGIEADTIVVESTIAGHDATFEGSWSGSWANIKLHPEGDQIVVTAIDDGSEVVVHREHYEP